jgi:hypothetical protein
MEVIIKKPSEVSENEINQIVHLIDEGSQIQGDIEAIKLRLKNSVFISYILDGGEIITTATLKNPIESYRKKVFESAKFDSYMQDYQYEIGYIVTAKNREGEKLCQKLLSAFFPLITNYKMFATTRKESMIHILGKFDFKVAGEKYNTELSLLVN